MKEVPMLLYIFRKLLKKCNSLWWKKRDFVKGSVNHERGIFKITVFKSKNTPGGITPAPQAVFQLVTPSSHGNMMLLPKHNMPGCKHNLLANLMPDSRRILKKHSWISIYQGIRDAYLDWRSNFHTINDRMVPPNQILCPCPFKVGGCEIFDLCFSLIRSLR